MSTSDREKQQRLRQIAISILEEAPQSQDISMDEEHLQPPNTVIIEQDWAPLDINILSMERDELAEIGKSHFVGAARRNLPPIIHISAKDLPPILGIGIQGPLRDLSYTITDCFHGTSWAAAEKISREGFRVGSGGAVGAGIYFSLGGMSIARSYANGRPCIIRARVHWGNVAYADDSGFPPSMKGSGDAVALAAKRLGYDALVLCSEFSRSKPTIGIVLGTIGSYIKPPRIEVVELIDPRSI
jgi:hypothetical protein